MGEQGRSRAVPVVRVTFPRVDADLMLKVQAFLGEPTDAAAVASLAAEYHRSVAEFVGSHLSRCLPGVTYEYRPSFMDIDLPEVRVDGAFGPSDRLTVTFTDGTLSEPLAEPLPLLQHVVRGLWMMAAVAPECR